eukprot:gnl/MRDRNA2_/MRDRNA2_29694_c0_seq1.p1 gnl/MRDRNA2_/MRDRNA2_29694_c0~~gnl/MRDRNA2_/MRDRNA2_29694_c0_seq1.p1  ORF type:complete len:693 (-),score=117.50 gnl/MRDRNA2_/MRDRNA2_29694_c0_seq1:357-2435(-)
MAKLSSLPVKCAKGAPPSLPMGKGKGDKGSDGKGQHVPAKGTPPPLPSVKGKRPDWIASHAQGCKGSARINGNAAEGKGPLQKSNIRATLEFRAEGDKENRTSDTSTSLNCADRSKNAYPPHPTGLDLPARQASQNQREVALAKRRSAELAARADVHIACHWSSKADIHRIKPTAGLDTLESAHCNLETAVFSRLAALTQLKCTCDARISDAESDAPTKERDPTRILLLQQAQARDAIVGASLVDAALANEEKSVVGQPSKLVVLPEGFITEILNSGAEHLLQGLGGDAPPELMPYAAVAAQHQVYIVCGTVMEPEKPGAEQWYTTTVVLGPDGRAVGAYRKRRIHRHEIQVAGDRPLTFEVPGFGRIGVLICLDAEDDALLEEMVALGVRCVINPIHIPVPGLNASRGSKGLALRQWRVALDSFARRLEWWSAQHCMFFVRCDLPFPGGLGTSQVIGPEKTETISSMDSDVLTVSLTPAAVNGPNQLFVKVPSSSYLRSMQEENCGPRAKVARVCLKREEPVAVMRFCYPPGSPCGKLLVVFEDKSFCIIDVATLSIEETSTATPAECHEQIQETLTNMSIPSAKGPGAWLDEECRCLLQINSTKQLEVVQCRAEGRPLPPLVISTTSPAERLAVDHLSGSFAVATSLLPHMAIQPDINSNEKQKLSSSCVCFWGFSHNRIPAPLTDFVKE